MTQKDETGKQFSSADRALWGHCAGLDAPEDEAALYLDLAGFADGRLDRDEQERVAALLADNPGLAADVAAARAQAGRAAAVDPAPAPEAILARACALVSQSAGNVVPFVRPSRPETTITRFTRWASLAAAMLVASWLGFALGSETSISLTQANQNADDAGLRDLFDPTASVMRDLGEGAQT